MEPLGMWTFDPMHGSDSPFALDRRIRFQPADRARTSVRDTPDQNRSEPIRKADRDHSRQEFRTSIPIDRHKHFIPPVKEADMDVRRVSPEISHRFLGYIKLVPMCAPNAIDDDIVSVIVGCCGHFTAPRSCSIRHPL